MVGNRKLTGNRRDFLRWGAGLAAGAPLALSMGCGQPGRDPSPPASGDPPPTSRADAKVAIVSCRTYGSAIQDALRQGFALLGGIHSLVHGKTVTVKVNLTNDGSFSWFAGRPPGESYMTDGATVIALSSLLLAEGAEQVRIVESAPFTVPLVQVVSWAGWDVPALLALGHVELENTRNRGENQSYARLPVPSGGYLFSYFDVNHSYQDTDVFVSLAKLKQHHVAGVTLSVKNLFGVTPNSLYGSEAPSENAVSGRWPLHGDESGGWGPIPLPGAKEDRNPGTAGSRVPRITADICGARPVDLAIIDGITAMSGGEGPWAPNPALTTPGVLIVGLNPVSTDAVGVAVMGYANPRAAQGTPPFTICDNHLLLAEQAGLGWADLSQIEVRGMTIEQARYPYT